MLDVQTVIENDRISPLGAVGSAVVGFAFSQDPAVEIGLRRIFFAWARIAERSDREASLRAFDRSPGYLFREVESSKIFVPFNLAYVSPAQEQLSELIGTAKDFQIQSDKDICLSGSAAFLGRIDTISDVDYAEYLVADNNATNNYIRRFGARRRPVSNSITFLSIRVGDRKRPIATSRKPPYTELWTAVSTQPWHHIHVQGFCWLSQHGRLEVTNKAFLALPRSSVRGSFLFQEITMAADLTGDPQRSLVEPENLRAYILHLRDSSRSLNRAGNATKSMKRAVALSLMLGLRKTFHLGLEILKDLSTNPARKDEARQFVSALIKVLDKTIDQKRNPQL
jgi:hypothetical protein